MDNEFDLSQSSKCLVFSSIIGFWLAAPTMVLAILSVLIRLVTGKIEFNEGVLALLMAALGVYVVFTLPLTIINQFNRIRVSNDGIFVEVYIFYYKWQFVKWEDINSVKLLPKLDRWGKSQWLVMIHKLTYWHRVISMQYGFGPQPGIVLNSDLENYMSLLEIIDKKHTKKNR